MSHDSPWTFLKGVGESDVVLVSVIQTLLGLPMIDMEGVCYGVGWNHFDRQNGHTCVSRSSYWGVLPGQCVGSLRYSVRLTSRPWIRLPG